MKLLILALLSTSILAAPIATDHNGDGKIGINDLTEPVANIDVNDPADRTTILDTQIQAGEDINSASLNLKFEALDKEINSLIPKNLTSIEQLSGNDEYYATGFHNLAIGQTFQNPNNFEINSIELLLSRQGSLTGDLVVNVYTDNTKTTLVQTSVAVSGDSLPLLNSSTSVYSVSRTVFTFSNPVSNLSAATEYYFELTATPSVDLKFAYTTTDYYANGNKFSTTSGGTQYDETTQDLIFVVNIAE